MKPRNTKRASSRRNKRSKTKRYFGGVSPNVAADNAKLAELIEYAENAGIRRQPNERLHEFLTLSPYASFRGKYLLQAFVSYIILPETDCSDTLENIIARTIAENSKHLINKTIVTRTVVTLLLHHNQFEETNRYINAIKMLLQAIPPITSQSLLRSLYRYITVIVPSPQVLEAMFDAGHFVDQPLFYNELIDRVNRAISLCVNNIESYVERYGQIRGENEHLNERLANLTQVRELLENAEPRKLRFSYVAYPAKASGTEFTTDVADELAAHLDAAERQEMELRNNNNI